MIALDTNILVRFLVDDDHQQADIASDLVSHPDGIFIAKTTLLELEWVLRHVYQIDKKILVSGLNNLLGLPNATIESVAQVAAAMKIQGTTHQIFQRVIQRSSSLASRNDCC